MGNSPVVSPAGARPEDKAACVIVQAVSPSGNEAQRSFRVVLQPARKTPQLPDAPAARNKKKYIIQGLILLYMPLIPIPQL